METPPVSSARPSVAPQVGSRPFEAYQREPDPGSQHPMPKTSVLSRCDVHADANLVMVEQHDAPVPLGRVGCGGRRQLLAPGTDDLDADDVSGSRDATD